jgi:antitoxin StbD
VIPFELYARLLRVIEDLEIAQLVRERAAAGESVPLADVAAAVGLDPAYYR